MEIKTRVDKSETTRWSVDEEEDQPLSPVARLYNSPELNCYVIAVVGIKKKIDPDVMIQGLKQSWIKHPRFSSIVVNIGKTSSSRQQQKWVRTNVVMKNHVIVPTIQAQNIENPDEFLETYVSDLTTVPLDTSKPLWELHLLDLKTSDAENIAIMKFHHSLGDGMSLLSLVIATMRKTSNPEELPSLSYHNRSSSSRLMAGSRGVSRFLLSVLVLWSSIMLVFNTICDALEFIATIMFLKDTETPIKGNYGTNKPKRMRLVHRTVSLDNIKIIKNAMKMTVNDVVLGVTQAGLSKYLKRRYESGRINSNELPKRIRLRSAVLVNLRPTTGIQELTDMMAKGSKCRWGNWIGYIILAFSIALHDDPLDYLRNAKRIVDRKKNSIGAALSFILSRFILKFFGVQAVANVIHKTFSNTTMSFSNLIGPIEEISFYGHPITFIAPSVYGHPHALTMHFQSYMNKMTVSLTVDPTVINDPHRLCDDWEESLRTIKAAVQERDSAQQ